MRDDEAVNISLEDAAKALRQDQDSRVKSAQAEIAATCEKHRVQLVPTIQFVGNEMRGDVLIQAR